MISLISPMASVVLASSKNSTVYMCRPYSSTFLFASTSAVLTVLIMSLFVVPPCTWSVSKVIQFLPKKRKNTNL